MKLVVTNTTNKPLWAEILKATICRVANFGLPDGLEVRLDDSEITYNNLLDFLYFSPVKMKFAPSTNNKRLSYWIWGLFGEKRLQKKPRPGILMLWNFGHFITIKIRPNEVFEIELAVIKNDIPFKIVFQNGPGN